MGSRPSSSQFDSILNETNREKTIVSNYEKNDYASDNGRKSGRKPSESRHKQPQAVFGNDLLL